MKKIFGIALVTAMLSASLTIPAFASAKTGALCTKAGLTSIVSGKKYTCVKSGKKLVWDKGVLQLTPKPTPTPSAVPTPTPSPVKQMPIPDAPISKNQWKNLKDEARQKFLADLPNENSLFKLNLVFESSVPTRNRLLVTESMEILKKSYSGYFPSNSTMNVISVASQVWGQQAISQLDPGNQKLIDDMKVTLPKQNPDNPNCDSSRSGAGGGFSIGYLSQPTVVLNIMNCPLSQVGTPPHEFTHSLQSEFIRQASAIDPNPGCYGPAWLREGQAQAASILLSFWDGKDQSQTTFKDILSRMDNPASKKDYLNYLENNDDNFQQYDIGAFTSLYLIARSGWAKSLNVWKRSAEISGKSCVSNPMIGFKQAFNEIYGQTLEDFYKEANEYLLWLYENRFTYLLATDIVQKPGEIKFQLNESCHAFGVNAELQKLVGANWELAAPAAGWIQASCPNTYLPYAYAHFTNDTTLRWHVYSLGNWDWYSTVFIYKP